LGVISLFFCNRELCKDLFKNWGELDDSLFSVERVSGGITNLLLKVSVKEDTNKEVSVTVRLYGPNTEYVINREREILVISFIYIYDKSLPPCVLIRVFGVFVCVTKSFYVI
jgi:hypothetical protein